MLAAAGVAAIVGARVTWAIRPQGAALPALVLTPVGGVTRTLVEGGADLGRMRVQADAFAATHKGAWDLIEAALAAVASPFANGGVRFASAGHTAARSLADTLADGATVFRATADFNLWHD